MKNKVCIIACYFGILPDWFDLWIYSAALNKNYDFLLITDSNIKSTYKNVRIITMSIQDFSELCSHKLKLNINIKAPYKLCDFKPVYGIIFEEYLNKYNFWGHCDLDQIWGRIEVYVNDKILDEYDKINLCGHFTLYRNTIKINKLYECTGAAFDYKTVFTNDYNYAFDETTGINRIALKQKIKQININCFADIDKRFHEFRACNQLNFDKQIFCYCNGRILQYYIDNDNICCKEYMYIHFQTKKPKFNVYINSSEENYIVINSCGFHKIDKIIDEKIIQEYCDFISNGIEKKEKVQFKIKQLKKFLLMPTKKKIIRLKQSIYKTIKPY